MSRTITTTLYSFEELPDDVKKKVLDAHREDFNEVHLLDIYKSVEAIVNACNMELTKTWTLYPRLKFNENDIDWFNLDMMHGRRALAYVWNNYIEPNLEGKYYSSGIGKTHYHSKATKEFSCPFTGYYVDNVLYMAWKELCGRVKAKEKVCVCDFVDILTDIIRKEIETDDYLVTSDEFLEEMFELNNYEFFEDGTIF